VIARPLPAIKDHGCCEDMRFAIKVGALVYSSIFNEFGAPVPGSRHDYLWLPWCPFCVHRLPSNFESHRRRNPERFSNRGEYVMRTVGPINFSTRVEGTETLSKLIFNLECRAQAEVARLERRLRERKLSGDRFLTSYMVDVVITARRSGGHPVSVVTPVLDKLGIQAGSRRSTAGYEDLARQLRSANLSESEIEVVTVDVVVRHRHRSVVKII